MRTHWARMVTRRRHVAGAATWVEPRNQQNERGGERTLEERKRDRGETWLEDARAADCEKRDSEELEAGQRLIKKREGAWGKNGGLRQGMFED
ncbi:hypothetical protein NDU88_003544 [Pleurodeles waltl]|uniref:Uncharacterized protein n=1 Tax=Pleurodeles waltl TaxID=8319 RepID=A0AAV7KVT0_PLEWA|nr:hypothetical protein NDU88_003544 [Pleurodeles waltl]